MLIEINLFLSYSLLRPRTYFRFVSSSEKESGEAIPPLPPCNVVDRGYNQFFASFEFIHTHEVDRILRNNDTNHVIITILYI